MFNYRKKRPLRNWQVSIDGAIRPALGVSGLAVVVYNESRVVLWRSRLAGKMTCNEAEYAAAIFALDQLMPYRPLALLVRSDSQVLVRQMRGEASVRSPALMQMHRLLRERASNFEEIVFVHIPREQNRLADALAYEAVMRQTPAFAPGSLP